MKTVDVSSMFEHLLPKLTHFVYRVWDNEHTCNDPLKTTLTQAVCNDLRERVKGGGGLTYILVDSRVEHREEWTKELEIEKCPSLIPHFTNGSRYTDEECKKLVSFLNIDYIVKFANKGE